MFRSRRPPCQSTFHDVSLNAGILSKIVRHSRTHYQLTSNQPSAAHHNTGNGTTAGSIGSNSLSIPNNLTLASDPRLLAWRLDTNAWLVGQQKYVSKQVSLQQMDELRILFDALTSEDKPDTLDVHQLATAMKVCAMKEEECKGLAIGLLELMGKSRYDSLTFAEFASAVFHYECPVTKVSTSHPGSSGSNSHRAAFGSTTRMQPLLSRLMPKSEEGNRFAQVVMEFKRHKLYEQIKKTTAMQEQ